LKLQECSDRFAGLQLCRGLSNGAGETTRAASLRAEAATDVRDLIME